MPIREYETEDHPGETAGERVIIEVDSLQRELEETRLFAGPRLPADAEVIVEDGEDGQLHVETPSGTEETVDRYVIVSVGRLSREGNMLQLAYTEELGEEEGAPVQVSLTFPPGEKGPVFVSRTGAMRTAFTIQEGVRQYSVYDTEHGKMELCVIGRRIENRIDTGGGVMRLDYIVELRGLIAQRTKMTIRVRPERA